MKDFNEFIEFINEGSALQQAIKAWDDLDSKSSSSNKRSKDLPKKGSRFLANFEKRLLNDLQLYKDTKAFIDKYKIEIKTSQKDGIVILEINSKTPIDPEDVKEFKTGVSDLSYGRVKVGGGHGGNWSFYDDFGVTKIYTKPFMLHKDRGGYIYIEMDGERRR